MLSWLKNKEKPKPIDEPPSALGLRLGGAFELDSLFLRLIEPELVIEGAASMQLIQAVGEINLDHQTRLLRYYTDDGGFIQLLQQGRSDTDIVEARLFYFYKTTPVDTEIQWENLLSNELVKSSWEIEGKIFSKAWDNVLPVAMTEKTWYENNIQDHTDQFIMVYERPISQERYEGLVACGEEKIINNQAERSLIISTNFQLNTTDFTIIG